MNPLKKNVVLTSVVMLILLSYGFLSCNSPEKAAMLISKKAKQQAAKLNFGKEMKIENPMDELESIMYSPTISEIIIEKTELIATW